MSSAGVDPPPERRPHHGAAAEPGSPPLHPVRSAASSTVGDGPAAPPPQAEHHHHRRGELDLDAYFTGPRDMARHSRWPAFLRLHGSILPKLILPLVFVSAWATAVTVVSQRVRYLGASSVLLTITGFVVGLGLSFRNSTAYERYAEGRRYWAGLVQASHVLGRVFWIHAADPPGRDPRELLLARLAAMNLVVAFSVALKHALRFEPYTAHPDLAHLVGHLDTFARAATEAGAGARAGAGAGAAAGAGGRASARIGSRAFFREAGNYLGVCFTASNPRKAIKRASRPLGNLPLEILNHIAATIDMLVAKDQLRVPMQQTLAYNNLTALNDVLTGTERVLCTPLPIAYTIAISQITWLYVCLLPFQLLALLNWVAIPATIAASYIILGLLFIGQEIENPFGDDVNDLPLDSYCEQIAADLDIIASYDSREPEAFLMSDASMPLYPTSAASAQVWMQRSEEKLRDAIKLKPVKTFDRARWATAKSANGTKTGGVGDHNNMV